MEEKTGCAKKKKGKADMNRISERGEGRKIRVCEEGRGSRLNRREFCLSVVRQNVGSSVGACRLYSALTF